MPGAGKLVSFNVWSLILKRLPLHQKITCRMISRDFMILVEALLKHHPTVYIKYILPKAFLINETDVKDEDCIHVKRPLKLEEFRALRTLFSSVQMITVNEPSSVTFGASSPQQSSITFGTSSPQQDSSQFKEKVDKE